VRISSTGKIKRNLLGTIVDEKVQLRLAFATNHEFRVPANLFRSFGAILATDQRFITGAG
jgi:hypothetical protein